MLWLWIGLALLLVALGVLVIAVLARRTPNVAMARALFQRMREHLEADFFRAAAASGKPRGLRWTGCDWDGGTLAFARDRKTGQLVAMVGVTISFEAVEGGDMEGLPAVGNLRNASAVFVFQDGRWTATGRAVFNLNPDEAIAHFGGQYERVEAG